MIFSVTWTCPDCGLQAKKRMGLIPWLLYVSGDRIHSEDPFKGGDEMPCPGNWATITEPWGSREINFGHYYANTNQNHPLQKLAARLFAERFIWQHKQNFADWLAWQFMSDGWFDSYDHYTEKVGLKPVMAILRTVNYELRGRDNFR